MKNKQQLLVTVNPCNALSIVNVFKRIFLSVCIQAVGCLSCPASEPAPDPEALYLRSIHDPLQKDKGTYISEVAKTIRSMRDHLPLD